MIKSIGNHVRRHRLSGPKYKNLNYLLTLSYHRANLPFFWPDWSSHLLK